MILILTFEETKLMGFWNSEGIDISLKEEHSSKTPEPISAVDERISILVNEEHLTNA